MPRPPANDPLLSPELIFRTALQLIDADGPEQLSMRKLAGALKVNPMSLYHHVPNKEALLRGVYAEALSELELPGGGGPWQEQLRLLAARFRALGQHHAKLFPSLLVAPEFGGRDQELFESLYAAIHRAGVPPELVARTGRVLLSLVSGFILAEVNGTLSKRSAARLRAGAEAQPDRFPVTLGLPRVGTDPDADFELALDLLIAGVEGLARRAGG